MEVRLKDISGLIRAAAWPAIAVVALLLFFGPVNATLQAISRQSNAIEDVKLGGLELKIRPSDLPTSSTKVANSIIGLPEGEIVLLLEIGPDSGHGYCRSAADSSFDQNTGNPLQDLKSRGLISIEQRTDNSDPHCQMELYAKLTDDGKVSRTFIVNLVTAQLKTATPSAGGGGL